MRHRASRRFWDCYRRFLRLQQGVSPGGTIEITTATDWAAPRLPTTLVSFRKIETAVPEQQETVAAAP